MSIAALARCASATLLFLSMACTHAQGLLAGADGGAVVQTGQVRAELLAWAPQGVAPGKPLWAGLRLTHQPRWHTYWKNPGDSGLATQLDWKLPSGITAGAIQWPAPQKIPVGSLANYGFENTVLLPVPLTVAPGFRAEAASIDLKLSASWLVCKEECVPQEGRFSLSLPVKGSTALHAAEFEQAARAAPQAHRGASQLRLQGQALLLRVEGLPLAWQGQSLNAFPEMAEIVETALAPAATDAVHDAATDPVGPAAPGQQVWSPAEAVKGQSAGAWQVLLPLSSLRSAQPGEMAWVLSHNGVALRVLAPVQGSWPAAPVAAAAGATAISPVLQAALDKNRAATGTAGAPMAENSLQAWALALGAAVLGGLILNLMPCVFPVLALKVLSFARPASARSAAPGRHRLEGLAYTAGVVLSMLALGGLMLALRAGGEQLGWGFQLQSPAFVAALALLFSLIGLNLMGLLEWQTLVPSGLASLQLRHPVADAGLSGVLAVAVASPCTAPLMGASLGYAVTLPALQALSIFAALGLGLALPYLLASWWPGLARALPRPGAWMNTLRRFLAFPMGATVLWLLWVLGALNGVDSVVSLLALIWALAFLAWALAQPGRFGRALRLLALASLLLLGVWLGPSVVQTPAAPPGPLAREGAAPGDVIWQPWRPGRVEQELAAGRAVFVDFTAAWCITCQYNKKTTLSDPAVLQAFEQRQVVLLRADWTRRDPAITEALAALGRTGVPVYVLHAPGRAPVVLSEILRADSLQSELAKL